MAQPPSPFISQLIDPGTSSREECREEKKAKKGKSLARTFSHFLPTPQSSQSHRIKEITSGHTKSPCSSSYSNRRPLGKTHMSSEFKLAIKETNNTLPSNRMNVPAASGTIYTQELHRRILSISIGRDHWSEALASIRYDLNQPDTPLDVLYESFESTKKEIFSLLKTLEQPFRYFDEPSRATLIHAFDPNHSGINALVNVQKSIEDCIAVHEKNLLSSTCEHLKRLAACYRDYLKALADGDEDARRQLLMPKAWCSCIEGDFYYIPLERGHELLCCNIYGETIRKNETGIHAVAPVCGVHYKPCPEGMLGAILPSMEHAIMALHQLFTDYQVAAATSVIKVSGVPRVVIPSPRHASIDDKDAYNQLSTRRLGGERASSILRDEGIKKHFENLPTEQRNGLVQAGYTIEGVLMLDIVEAQNYLAFLLKVLTREQAIQLVDALLTNPKQFTQLGQELMDSVSHEKRNSRDHFFCAYKKLSETFPQNARLKEFDSDSDLDTQLRDFNLIFDGVGPDALLQTLGLLKVYPRLMVKETLSNLSRLQKHLIKVLPEVISENRAEVAFEEVPTLWSKLDPEASSGIFIGSMLSLTTDSKFDNVMAQLIKNPITKKVISILPVLIDGEGALRPPILANKDSDYSAVVTIKNSLYFLEEFMKLPLHPHVISRLLSKDATHWLVDWLIELGLRDKAYQRWLLSEVVDRHDTHEFPFSDNHQRVDIPFHLPRGVVVYIFLTKLKELIKFVKDHQEGKTKKGSSSVLTHEDILNHLFPDVAYRYRQHRMHTPNLRDAEKIIYKHRRRPNAMVPGGSEESSSIPIEPYASDRSPSSSRKKTTISLSTSASSVPWQEAFMHVPARKSVDSELQLPIPSLVNEVASYIPWHEYSRKEQLLLIDALTKVFPNITIPTIELKITGQELLVLAAAQGLISAVTWLISQGVEVNVSTSTGEASVLHIACGNWRDFPERAATIFRLLLAAGANPNGYNSRGYTPLIQLLSQTQDDQVEEVIPLVEILREAGAVLDWPEKDHPFSEKDHALPLDKLMSWRRKGNGVDQRFDGMPRLFAMLVKMGARRVNPERAFFFIQRYHYLPEIIVARDLLKQHHLGILWQLMKVKFWAHEKPKDGQKAIKLLVQGEETGYLHPILVQALCHEEMKTSPREAKVSASGQRVLRANLSYHRIFASADPQLESDRASKDCMRGSSSIEQPDAREIERKDIKKLHVTIDNLELSLRMESCPKLPDMQYAVYQLNQNILGKGIVPNELIGLIYGSKGDLVLISPLLEGSTLEEVLNNPELSHILPQLEPETLSALICFSMFINLGNSPNHYIVQTIPNPSISQGAKQPSVIYRLMSVNNVNAFVRPTPGKKHHLECILFCLEAMKSLIHPTVRAQLLALDPVKTLTTWLKSMDAYYEHVARMPNQQNPIEKNMPLSRHDIIWLFGKLLRLQEALRKNETLTHFELFFLVDPDTAHLYDQPFSYHSPRARFEQIVNQRGEEEVVDITLDSPISAKQALEELAEIVSNRRNLESVKQALLGGDSRPFFSLALDDDKAAIVNGIDWTTLVKHDGTPDIVKQNRLVNEIICAKISFRKLVINNTPVLTDDQLVQLLECSSFLNHIDISGCVRLTNTTIYTLAKHQNTLISVNLDNLPLLTEIEGNELGNSKVLPSDITHLREMIANINLGSTSLGQGDIKGSSFTTLPTLPPKYY